MSYTRTVNLFVSVVFGVALAQEPVLPKAPETKQEESITSPTVVPTAPGKENFNVIPGASVTVFVVRGKDLLKAPTAPDKFSLLLNGKAISKAGSVSLDGDVARLVFTLPEKFSDQSLLAMLRRGEALPLSIEKDGGQPLPTRVAVSITEPPHVTEARTASKTVRLENPIVLRVVGYSRWLDEQKRIDAATGDDAHVRLFLSGHEIVGVLPKVAESSDGTTLVSFDMKDQVLRDERENENRIAWVGIVTTMRRNEDLTATLGIEKSLRLMRSDTILTQDDKRTRLHLYSTWSWIVLGLIGGLAGAIVYLGIQSDLVREIETDEAPVGKRSCYSLARCQMAVWFFVVIAAYIYITLTFGRPPVITPTILTLIGISAGTGLAATVIDNAQRNERIKQVLDFKTRIDFLNTRIADIKKMLPAPLAATPTVGGAAPQPALDPAAAPASVTALEKEFQEKATELAEVRARAANLPPAPPPRTSAGFLKDLLQESGSVSFHRFQIAVWTIVLAIIFVRAVWHDLAMPEFDTTLLGLMGISSGTYIGFKFPDKPLPTSAGVK